MVCEGVVANAVDALAALDPVPRDGRRGCGSTVRINLNKVFLNRVGFGRCRSLGTCTGKMRRNIEGDDFAAGKVEQLGGRRDRWRSKRGHGTKIREGDEPAGVGINGIRAVCRRHGDGRYLSWRCRKWTDKVAGGRLCLAVPVWIQDIRQ